MRSCSNVVRHAHATRGPLEDRRARAAGLSLSRSRTLRFALPAGPFVRVRSRPSLSNGPHFRTKGLRISHSHLKVWRPPSSLSAPRWRPRPQCPDADFNHSAIARSTRCAPTGNGPQARGRSRSATRSSSRKQADTPCPAAPVCDTADKAKIQLTADTVYSALSFIILTHTTRTSVG